MYRIRSAAGTEAVYNSLEEFSAAVHRGAVHPEDEIFHTRANRWLDVKSHPHYRSALDWSGPVSAPAAPAPTPPPPPMRTAPAQTPVATSSSRAQVFERPQVKAAPQTTLRPQLQAASAPKLPAPASLTPAAPASTPAPARPSGPVVKSRELSFVNLGDANPTRGNSAVAEPPRKQAPPIAEPARAPTEVEFLVMDGGIESPVRSSTGHRTIPEDLDLLFDAPIESTEHPTSGRVSTGKVPKVAAVPARPVAKVEAAPAQPVVVPPAPATPKVEARLAAPAAVPAQPQPGTPPAPPAPRVITAEDLAIPGGPLAARAEDFPAELPTPVTHAVPKSHGLMIVGIVASLAVSGGLLAWHPWSDGGATSAVAAESVPGAPGAVPSESPATGKATNPAPVTGAPVVSAPGKPGTPVVPPATATRSDSLVSQPQEETVIAAVKPNFSGAVNLGAADLALGGDVRAPATVTAISPAELTRRLESSERQVEQELQSRLAAAGFRGVFGGDRLATSDGVAGARTAWAAGADALRQFRARVARLEQAYADSVLSSQRAQKWTSEEMRSFASHQSPAEPADVAQLSDLMMSQVGEALEILAALDGQYEYKSGVITFRTPASATRFTGIRGWVDQRMQTWQAIPEGARPRSISAILRALGDGLPNVR